MSSPSPSRAPRSRARTVFIAGIVVVAVAAVAYGVTASSTDRTDFVAAGPPEVVDGKARVTYVLPSGTSVYGSGTVMGYYDFPREPGDVFLLGCAEHARFLAGDPLNAYSVVARSDAEGMFHKGVSSVLGSPPASLPPCASALYLVLEWDAAADWRSNTPNAVTELVQNPTMEGPIPVVLLGVAALGGVGSVAGGLAWRRESQAFWRR